MPLSTGRERRIGISGDHSSSPGQSIVYAKVTYIRPPLGRTGQCHPLVIVSAS